MKEGSRQLLDKAQQAIKAAQSLRRDELLDFAIGRAYYAMFYAAEALLHEQGKRFSKHSGVHSGFSELFIKTNKVDRKYHRWLLDAFNRRIVGDYAVNISFSVEETDEMIEHAIEFVNIMTNELESQQSIRGSTDDSTH